VTVLALIKTPLRSVDRKPKGAVLGLAEGHINSAPLLVTLTEGEIHIGFSDRNGPAFVLELNHLVKAAMDEIEIQLGLQKKGAR
jgi:hypothetical protein